MRLQTEHFARERDKIDHLVQVKGLTRIYRTGKQEIVALCGVSLSINFGVFVAIKGRSGSGKTTLLNLMGGLDRSTSGKVYLNGQLMSHLSERKLTEIRRHIGFVFQSYLLLPTLSAYENVELSLRIIGVGAEKRRLRTQECLKMVGLERWSHHRPYEMSGGQRQRIAIARALTADPILLLVDEPTGELDSKSAHEIMALFRNIVSREKRTVVMATHDHLVNKYADIVYEISDGRIVGSTSPPQSVLQSHLEKQNSLVKKEGEGVDKF